jgi:transcriptional regulator with XRE-family HTH domain
MTLNDSIAARIRHAREQAQLAPAELRRLLRKDHGIDLSKTGLHRLETVDSTNPNLKLIQAIAEVARVSPSWILFGEGTSVPGEEVGSAIRSRVIDTIELMLGALDMTVRQESTITKWLKSIRENPPKTVRKP